MRKKILPPLKSFLILVLAAVAVFQVSRLWFVNLTNRNFFLYLQARFPPAAPDGQSAFARPFRIITGAGDGAFEVRYSGIADSEAWIFGEAALDAILRRGAHDAASVATFSQVLSQPALIFEYAFEMDAEIFARAFGRRNGALLTDAGVAAFTSIVMPPPDVASPQLRAYFVSEDEVFAFALPLGTRHHAAEDFFIEIMPVPTARKHFVRTEAGFVPRAGTAAGGGFSYHAVRVQNPFQNPQGLFTLTDIRPLVEPFFDNPATIIPSVSVDGVYTFSNRNTMVRYLENAVLEYTSYRTIGASTDDFMADFSAALAFVNYNDASVVNEIFLSSHDTHGRAHIFRFNYVIDNRPLVLTGPWHTRPHCNDPLIAPIEVTVENGRVVRYRRIVYTFETTGLFWKSAADFDIEGYFKLGFPLGGGPTIELAVLVEE